MSNASDRPDLATDNTAAYWEKAWADEATGWKAAESEKFPLDANVFRALNAVGWIPADEQNTQPQREVIVKAVERFLLQQAASGDSNVTNNIGMSCFVPLCGDTGVVRYLYDVISTAVVNLRKIAPVNVNCVISGVDIAPVAIDRMIQSHFADFTRKDATTTTTTTTPLVDIALKGEVEGVSVRLFIGDLFDASEAIKGTIDFVYDNASMVAMHPSLRSKYVEEGIKRTLRVFTPTATPTTATNVMVSPVVYLVQVVRTPATRMSGPPFHIPVASLTEQHYTQAQGWTRFVIDDLDGIEELSEEDFKVKLPTISPLLQVPIFAFAQHAFALKSTQ